MDDSKWDKPGKGTLFGNRKKTHQFSPDYTGSFVCERAYKAGEKIQFGMWEKQTKSGHTYYSLSENNYQSYKDKQKVTEDKEVEYAPRKYKHNEEDDNSIPF